MIPELFFLTPADVALDPAAPPLPLWFQLSLAGAVTLITALALTLG
jgi:hypothetical protein